MKNLVFLVGVLAVVIATAMIGFVLEHAPGEVRNEPGGSRNPKGTLKAFSSEAELREFLSKLKARSRTRGVANSSISKADGAVQSTDQKESAPTVAAESITNVQSAGVDEGGIVKVHKNHLVILRRGRLFTVRIGDGELAPVSTVDAFGPEIDPSGTWYDEMLISDRTVAVIGYSYQRGGTEIGVFRIDDDGRLAFRSTWHLRSNDYYSARNYASRLIDGKLVFYTPQFLGYSDEPIDDFPAVRKWRSGASSADFKPITAPKRVYRVPDADDFGWETTLHSVTTCDLESDDFECSATSVIGPAGRVFYVSAKAVYIWVTSWNQRGGEQRAKSTMYRMPLDGSAPSAVGVSGSPVDQFSFLEGEDGFINVLVRSNGSGDGMWRSNFASGDSALLRLPLESFGDGTDAAPSARYRSIPSPKGWNFHNRFIGKYLLYGSAGDGYRTDADSESKLYAVRWTDGAVHTVDLKHGVERIEAMGADAVVVGSRGPDLYFTSVSLSDGVRAESNYVRRNAAQGESRSHGFFYRSLDRDSGILGLPIVGGRDGYNYYDEYISGSASVVFLRNESLDLKELGELQSKQSGRANDGCRASCVDWYGNARPVFLKGRIFALLGYEIVEGAIDDGRIRETRRISFAPGRN